MDSEQVIDNGRCICRAKEIRPSSKCIRKNGFYRRGRSKVQRYKCNRCERVFSFPPKKKRQETRGRPFKLLERPLSKFKHWEDYYLIQIIGKLSTLSGRSFYEELWDFVPLSKEEVAPKISRNIKFSDLDMCRNALAYLNKNFPIMCRGERAKYVDVKRWISSVNHFLVEKVYERETGTHFPSPAEAMAMAEAVIAREKQQPLFVRTMLFFGVFGEFNTQIQEVNDGFSKGIEFPFENEAFFNKYFYGK